jgi:glycogen operon protein
MNENLSWNCGVEGPTDDPAVAALRRRQRKNFLTLLMLAQGTPMLLAGDEMGRTQQGNNNAYCQDNAVSWVDWRLLEAERELHRFTKLLIAFRRAHPVLRRRTFLTGSGTDAAPQPDVAWHGLELDEADFSPTARVLAMHLAGIHAPAPDGDVYLAVNNGIAAQLFELPAPHPGGAWLRAIDTARPEPEDIADPGHEPIVAEAWLRVEGRSCVVLRSQRTAASGKGRDEPAARR